MSYSNDLLQKLKAYQDYLIGIATGSSSDNEKYTQLRQFALGEKLVKNRLPGFIRSCRDLSQFWSFITQDRPTYKQRREYIWAEFSTVLKFLEAGGMDPAFSYGEDIIRTIDSPHVFDAWQNAYGRLDTDPEGAITLARTLVESACIFILEKANVTRDNSWDLPRLYKEAANRLNLSPAQHGEEVFKQILGGCHSIVNGLSALRNQFSDSHGKGTQYLKPSRRHAALAVNVAGTLATFLTETYEEKGVRPLG